MDECNTLKAQTKKLKGNTGGNTGKAKGQGKNKTCNNKSKDESVNTIQNFIGT